MDERIKNGYHKIYSEALTCVVFFAAISLVIKTTVLQQGIRGSWTEYCILIFVPLYTTIRQYRLGLVADYDAAKMRKIFAVRIFSAAAACTAVWIAVMYFRTGRVDWMNLCMNLVPFLIFFVLTAVVAQRIREHRRKKLDEKYGD